MVRHRILMICLCIMLIGVYMYITQYNSPVEAMKLVDDKSVFMSRTNKDLNSLFWTVTFIGGCIAMTLSYVSWRKYKEERKKQSKNDSNS